MKISKEELLAFDQNIVSILSERRLKGYEGSIDQYYENFYLILEVAERIGHLEVYLRNKLDYCLKKLEGEEWIKSAKSLEIIKKDDLALEELDCDQILSQLTLGKIVRLITAYKIRCYIFDLSKMDFKKYHRGNRNFFYANGRRYHLSNVAKVAITLNLIRNIRNRAFHWENLFKFREIDGEKLPRITDTFCGSTIGIMPESILDFLDDLLDVIGNEVIEKYRSIKDKRVKK